MALTSVRVGTRQSEIDVVAPAAQASANAAAVVTGSNLDMRGWKSLAYTLANITNTITWWTYGANLSTFADEVIVDGPNDVLAAASGSYAVAQAPYAYYRTKIMSKVNGSHGTCTVVGVAKG